MIGYLAGFGARVSVRLDPLQWSTADAKRQNDNNFTCMGCVGESHLGCIHMIELPDAVLACQRHSQ